MTESEPFQVRRHLFPVLYATASPQIRRHWQTCSYWELGARDGICVSSLVTRLPFSVRQACNVSLPLHQALPEDPDRLVFGRPWAHVVSGNLAGLKEGEACDVLSVFVGSAWRPPRVEPGL